MLINRFPVALFLLFLSGVVCAQNCDESSVGLTPLNDLGNGTYLGYEGGLYPGGANLRPAAHETAGLHLAGGIKPLDGFGTPDPGGKYVLVSIGMSNATQEFQYFIEAANQDLAINPELIIVDGAQGGQVASIIADPEAGYWSVLDNRLASAGVTGNQVAVAWVKNANVVNAIPAEDYRNQLQDNLEEVARVLKARFPNLVLVYFSSRIYAGYATTRLNPEPYAYESGFVVKWTIEKQLSGDASLNFDETRGTVNAPWLAWGPYLWADGLEPRSDNLQWLCSDLEADGTHPSVSGRQKVGAALLDFFKTDSTAREWFTKTVDTVAPAAPRNLLVEP